MSVGYTRCMSVDCTQACTPVYLSRDKEVIAGLHDLLLLLLHNSMVHLLFV